MIRFPPRKILVACDFSAVSAHACRQAVSLAALFHAPLEVVHVRPWPRSAELASFSPPPASSEEKSALQARIRALVGIDVPVELPAGEPAQAILSAARRARADLIVVGTHGRTGLKRMLLGSVAEAVARGARVPVLVARGARERARSILAPVNFTGYSDRSFDYAASLAEALRARLTALHIRVDPIWSPHPERRLTELVARSSAARRGVLRTRMETRKAGATSGVLAHAAAHDLLVLSAHGKSDLTEALLGTTAQRVLRGSERSVLFVPVR